MVYESHPNQCWQCLYSVFKYTNVNDGTWIWLQSVTIVQTELIQSVSPQLTFRQLYTFCFLSWLKRAENHCAINDEKALKSRKLQTLHLRLFITLIQVLYQCRPSRYSTMKNDLCLKYIQSYTLVYWLPQCLTKAYTILKATLL